MRQPDKTNHQPVIIAGMHRSGTSLTAAILEKAGVNVGNELLEANTGNPQGYFEDKDFLSLHQEILISQGLSAEGWTTLGRVDVPQQFWAQAMALCDRRTSQHTLWGWKEPRTTLFLEFWAGLLPDAQFIFPYRVPWEVIDSLFVRGDPAFHRHPNFAAEVWIAYNQAVLDFCQRHPSQTFLFNCDVLKTDENQFVNGIAEKLELSLSAPTETLFQADVMHAQVSDTHRPALLASHCPQALEVYQALEAQAELPSQSPPLDIAALTAAADHPDWVLQDWFTASRAQGIAAKMAPMQVELQKIHAELHKTQIELQQTQAQLMEAQAQADHWQTITQAMEANRLWQLRNAWVGLKGALGLRKE